MRRLGAGGAVVLVLLTSFVLGATEAYANAIAGAGYSASYAGQSAYTNVAPGESGQASAIFFNDGTQPWLPGIVGLLACATDKVTCNVSANAGFNKNWPSVSVYATVPSAVLPGQNGYFVFNFIVPLGTPAGTATPFFGDLGIIATGALLRPQGYFHVNTTPFSLAAITPPSASVAVGAFQQFAVTAAAPGAAISWSVDGGCGAVTSGGLFAATAMNGASQPCNVVATVGRVAVRAPVIVYGPPTGMSCSVDRNALAADGGSTNQGTAIARVSLTDANGNVSANATAPDVRVVNVTPLLAQMNPLGLVTPSAGVVAVTITTLTTAGDIQVSASTPGFVGCNLVITAVGASVPAKTVASFTADVIAADSASTTEISVDITDAKGIRVGTDNLTQITITQTSGGGVCSFSGFARGSNPSIIGTSAAATASTGRVTFIVRASTTPGQCIYVVTANNTSIAGTSAILNTRAVGLASKLAIVTNDSPHPANLVGACGLIGANSDTSCTTIVVGVQDAQGVLTGDAGRTITATLDIGSCRGAGGGDVVQRASTSTSGGRATFAFSSAGSFASCAITFTSATLANVNAVVTWTAGTPDHLACAITPLSLPASVSTVARLDASVRDARGNVVTTGTYPIVLTHTGASTSIVDAGPIYSSAGVSVFTIVSRPVFGADTYTPTVVSGSRLSGTSCTVVVQ